MGKVSGGAGRVGGRPRAVTAATVDENTPYGRALAAWENEAGWNAMMGEPNRPRPQEADFLPPPAAAPIPAGTLGETRIKNTDYARIYSFDTTSGNYVDMSVSNTGSITFNVNGSYNRGNALSGAEANAVTLRLMRQIRQDAKTRPEGFSYHASANTGDGYGQERALAYSAIGMSRPERAIPGNPQYGVVRNGKLTQDDSQLRIEEGSSFSLYNSQWQRMRDQYQQDRSDQRARG